MEGMTMHREYDGRSAMTVIAALIVTAVLAGGCSEPQSMQIIDDKNTALKPEDSAAYLDRMGSLKGCVNENDAMRGILLLLDGEDKSANFTERVNKLASRGIVDRSWTFDASRPLTRGKMAYMVCQTCDIDGGVIMTVLGPSTRYCLRELRYKGIVVKPYEYGEVTGLEYVAVLSRADNYVNTGHPLVLSGEVPGS
jgi:hypothetical protein